jgi:N-acetylmuramoyl-L-alanine amidase
VKRASARFSLSPSANSGGEKGGQALQRRTAILIVLIIFMLPAICFAAENRAVPVQGARQAETTSVKNVLKGKTIVIDPGHGGSDPGAIGKSGLAEKDVTLAISTELRKLLEAKNAVVILTRTTDRDVHSRQASDAQELQSRVNIANKASADVFVSVHIDSFVDSTAKGTTTYFAPQSVRGELLASKMQQSLVEQINLPDRGFRENNFYVLKHATMPAVLAEVAFISNPSEEAKLQQPDFIKKAAYGLFTGLTRFFSIG